MANYLITGLAGSGKSAVGDVLRSRGFTVHDMDKTLISRWVDAHTLELATFNRGDGAARLKELRLFWDEASLVPQLMKTLHSADPVIYEGYAENLERFYQYFTKLILLFVDEAATRTRLLTRDSGDWGKEPVELDHALSHIEPYRKQLVEAGAVVIDASMPLQEVVSETRKHIVCSNK